MTNRDEKDFSHLTPEQYRITRLGGTEPAFSHPLYYNRRAGTYHCVCCDAALFSSRAKYDSGSGWPSFFAPLSEDALRRREDTRHGLRRVEVRCAACDAHLGHVFADGPPPTGLRYCINGHALRFVPREEEAGEGGRGEEEGR